MDRQRQHLHEEDWDGRFEIAPLMLLDDQNQPVAHDDPRGVWYEHFSETPADDDPMIACWGLYAHLKQGGVEHIADFKTRAQAEYALAKEKASRMYLVMEARSDDQVYYPDVFIIQVSKIVALRALLERARELQASVPGFRHLTVNFVDGTWAKLSDDVADYEFFQETDPIVAGWSIDCEGYNADNPNLDGFSVETDGDYLEFRAYDSDSGLYSWAGPVYLNGDKISYENFSLDLTTGKVSKDQPPF